MLQARCFFHSIHYNKLITIKQRACTTRLPVPLGRSLGGSTVGAHGTLCLGPGHFCISWQHPERLQRLQVSGPSVQRGAPALPPQQRALHLQVDCHLRHLPGGHLLVSPQARKGHVSMLSSYMCLLATMADSAVLGQVSAASLAWGTHEKDKKLSK